MSGVAGVENIVEIKLAWVQYVGCGGSRLGTAIQPSTSPHIPLFSQIKSSHSVQPFLRLQFIT